MTRKDFEKMGLSRLAGWWLWFKLDNVRNLSPQKFGAELGEFHNIVGPELAGRAGVIDQLVAEFGIEGGENGKSMGKEI